MTTKQIAEAVGMDERSVQRWVKRLSDSLSSINDKLSLSSPMNPAEYDIDETCHIIEEGLGKTASDIYRTNAVNAAIGKPVAKTKANSGKITGALVNAYIKAVDKNYMSPEQFQYLVGAPVIIKADSALVKANSAPLKIEAPIPKGLTKQAYSVEMKARAKLEQKRIDDKKNGDLFNG